MRSAKSRDYWKDIYSSKKYGIYLESIELEDCLGYSGEVKFNTGITVICGLNGVGKSTIISCIKQSLGFPGYSIVTQEKGHGVNNAILHYQGNALYVNPDNSAVDQGIDKQRLVYIDCSQSIELLKYWTEQSNIDEYLEQFESSELSDEQIKEVSWLVGKDYIACKSIEVDETKSYIPVFFEVTLAHCHYNSINMGLGEHFLMYIYYALNKMDNNSILIIEEPETFISILSQKRLMDYFAKVGTEKRISIIIATHSPHVLTMIKNDCIRIVGNAYGKMIISTPNTNQETREHLGVELAYNKTATVFVEDYVARLFLDVLLNEEAPMIRKTVDIVSVDGYEGITKRLSFNDREYMSHILIGVYDEDMKDKIEVDTKWPIFFLPIDKCVEIEINEFLKVEENAKKICNTISGSLSKMYLSISKRVGEDHHDWFLDLCRDLNVNPIDFIWAFYSIWKDEHKEEIDTFVEGIESVVLGKVGA